MSKGVYLYLAFVGLIGSAIVFGLASAFVHFTREPGVVVCEENGVEVFRARGTLDSSRYGRHIYANGATISPANTWTCREIRP